MLITILLNFYIISVNGFFYKLIPMVVINTGNNVKKAYCPWNQTDDQKLVCKNVSDVLGYVSSDVNDPKVHQLLNPSLQQWFTNDNCQELKRQWSSKKNEVNSCKDYSVCYTVTKDKHLCTCQNGFFGDPYTGCKQHCLTDDDCSSPVAYCHTSDTSDELSRCVCKPGYDGDGVMCKKNPCGNNRLEKCGSNKVCVPTGPGDKDYKCVCPQGKYLNHEDNCVDEHVIKKNTVITLVGKNVKDGSRVEVGECLSFTLNVDNKSIFFHKNSGDSVYVRKLIKNDNSFSVFFIITDEVTVFSSVKDQVFGLTKLYSMSNTFLGCKFGRPKIFDPSGHDVVEFEEEHGFKQTTPLKKGPDGQDQKPSGESPKSPSALETRSGTDPQKPQEQQGSSGSGPGQTTANQPSAEQRERVEPAPKKVLPHVEVYVRDLTTDEKEGGLGGATLPQRLVESASIGVETPPPSVLQSDVVETSVLQKGVSVPGTKGEL